MFGDRLRALRKSRGLSLRDLAGLTGLSSTMLSQIERGVTDPSLKSLRQIARVFGQSVATLFDDATGVQVSRPGERSTLSAPSGRIQYERVAAGNGRLEVLLGNLAPGSRSGDEPAVHESVECAYVLAGVLTVDVGGEVHELRQGEAITIGAGFPHLYQNHSQEDVEFLVSVTPPIP
ncbi:helix-turn-helix domain-containing protein [Enemella sp. A6]|uniref:helix-turn-helix domain-containing protein n=1 Tax=Enemella sp. A6 TaxID=3440152 RepID=UPI003EB898F3